MNFIKILFLATLPFFISNCSTEPENDFNSYKIKIDEMTCADTISVNDTLNIIFDGFVGPDGCHSFKYFEVMNSNQEINITVWGENSNYDAVCTQALVYLHGKEHKTKLSKSGDYKIIVHQPDNTKLFKTVNVK